jgi:hypothetical protein
MSKSSELDKIVKAYIIDQIDNSGYSEQVLITDSDKVQFLHDTFMSEYGWRVSQVGQIKALSDWFSGLPSCCTVAFYNSDILDLAVKWGSLPADYTERQADKILDNWFNLVANKTAQLFRKYDQKAA